MMLESKRAPAAHQKVDSGTSECATHMIGSASCSAWDRPSHMDFEAPISIVELETSHQCVIIPGRMVVCFSTH